MKNAIITFFLALCAFTVQAQSSIYRFTMNDENGKAISLAKYKGQVLLIVNTATRCGFTPQYEQLELIYEKYHAQGLEILDFPCNQFGQQAPGSMRDIRNFCTGEYVTRFPLFEKIDVNGDQAAPLFTFLKSQQPFRGFDLSDKRGQMMDNMLRRQDADYDKKSDIKWNFTKFLVDRRGNVIARFEPTESMQAVEAAIEKALLQ